MVSPGYSRPYASAFSIRYCAIRALIDPDGLRNSNFTHTPSTRISGVSPMLSRMVACHGATGRTVDPVELSRIVMATSELEASSNRTPARVHPQPRSHLVPHQGGLIQCRVSCRAWCRARGALLGRNVNAHHTLSVSSARPTSSMSTPTAESSHRVRGLRNIDVDGPGQPAAGLRTQPSSPPAAWLTVSGPIRLAMYIRPPMEEARTRHSLTGILAAAPPRRGHRIPNR